MDVWDSGLMNHERNCCFSQEVPEKSTCKIKIHKHTSVHLLLENTGNSKLLLMQQFRVHTERGRLVSEDEPAENCDIREDFRQRLWIKVLILKQIFSQSRHVFTNNSVLVLTKKRLNLWWRSKLYKGYENTSSVWPRNDVELLVLVPSCTANLVS